VTHVIVIGGGITGLAAAYELSGGAEGPRPTTPRVTLLDASRLGGKLRTASISGRVVDVGPDGFLARRPEATALVTELGATELLEPVGAQGAWVLARGRLRRLPPGLALGVPTSMRDLRTADAIGILGLGGALRASMDLVAPRRASRSALPDRAIGPLVADKLGHRVVDVLVDPLIGGIHAGRVRDLSAAAVYPPVLAAGQGRGSMMRALQAAAPPSSPAAQGPAFLTLRDGLGTLPDIVAKALGERGVALCADTPAVGLHRGAAGQPRWQVQTPSRDLDADAVVLASPSASAAALLAPLDADAAALAEAIDVASVVVVTLQFGADDLHLPDSGTGVLIPVGTPFGSDTYMTTAVTFLDRKWPHLARDGEVVLRVSLGRIDDTRAQDMDDDGIVARITDELASLFGEELAPTSSLVWRWPGAFPQYRVNHLVRVEGIESAAGTLGGLAVAGAAYRGVGIPACVASARAAARNVRAWLAQQS